jgi:hypothetical protein
MIEAVGSSPGRPLSPHGGPMIWALDPGVPSSSNPGASGRFQNGGIFISEKYQFVVGFFPDLSGTSMSKPSTRPLRWLREAAVFASRGKIAAAAHSRAVTRIAGAEFGASEAEGKLFLAAKP